MVLPEAFIVTNMTGEDQESSDAETEEAKEQKKVPAFTKSIQSAGDSLRDQLNEDIDIEEEADNINDSEVEMTLPQIERRLNQLAKSEVNSNRRMYRSMVYRNLTNQEPDWDEGVESVEAVNKIDDLIDTAVKVWVDRHVTEFAKEIDSNNDDRITLSDIGRIALSAGILQGIIEKVSADAIYEYGKELSAELIQWFIENTALNSGELMHAIEVFFRALFGV